ncbi:cation:proton antiporter [Dyadobacter subterraneus]|uniref:cation:proton antiporter n=1 Tax=Dyadobacter subterraneus TaxID=2773304 RepID=UPI001D16EB99|nr:cation:proton antiporter [Dyadobacter subterraneus]
MNQVLLPVSVLCLLVLLLTVLLKKFRQPYMIAYIIAGLLIGPHVANLLPQAETIEPVAEIGILLLMFFLGMEIEIPDRGSLLFKPLVAQGTKIILTLVLTFAVSWLAGWPFLTAAIIFILLIFNSTAVVSEYLRKNGELNSEFGKMILNVLLLQDLMLAPVLTLLQFMGGGVFSWPRITISAGASVLIFFMLRAIRNRDFIQLRLQSVLQDDHEIQVFAGSVLCLGFGLLAELSGLSGALGSFIAGIFIGRLDAFNWLEKSLHPFKVFFVALFFVSIGLRLDLFYIKAHLLTIGLGTMLLLLVNSLLSAVVFRGLKYSWGESLYGGALLSQIGEFGIVACSLAYKMQVIGHDLFKTGVAITALSLLFSTVWITMLRQWVIAKK